LGKTKIISEEQNKLLKGEEKALPWLKIISYEQHCQLIRPELFPVSNKPRLYKNVQNNIIDFLKSFPYAFSRLPSSYQDKIILGQDFNLALNQVLGRFEFLSKTKSKTIKESDGKEKSVREFTYQLYQKFFNLGLDGLIKTMPPEFQPYLKSQIKPLLLLMLSIARYSKTTDPFLIQNLNFPSFVFSDRDVGAMSSGF
jgi:hypothetical protein